VILLDINLSLSRNTALVKNLLVPDNFRNQLDPISIWAETVCANENAQQLLFLSKQESSF
jgi:hypothetical protein